ncbi:EF-hand domain-containing protein [Nonomuraea solani]|uniref:EF-hand domain-containing protein n=1 Tax=Nonomuraea solani TaxID=1144553 RepID=UPI001357FFC4|nr:EF-hand domain-containing protein [Nonomuraea solani]
MALAFKAIDLSQDDRLSWPDLAGIAEELSSRLHADKERELELTEAFQSWWRQFETKTGDEVTLDRFISVMKTGMAAGPAFYQQGPGRIVDVLIRIADRNGDGIISKEDYLAFYGGSMADESAVLAGYRKFDLNSDGAVTADEFRQAAYEFFTSEDLDATGSFLLGRPE